MSLVRTRDSGRTVLYPDLYILTNDEHSTVTPEAHKHAAAGKSFFFVTTANGEQQDIYILTTIPSVQRSLCLKEVTDDPSSTKVELPDGVENQTKNMLERCMATCGKAAGARAQMRSRARKEASAQEVRGYYKQFAEAKHLEWMSVLCTVMRQVGTRTVVFVFVPPPLLNFSTFSHVTWDPHFCCVLAQSVKPFFMGVGNGLTWAAVLTWFIQRTSWPSNFPTLSRRQKRWK